MSSSSLNSRSGDVGRTVDPTFDDMAIERIQVLLKTDAGMSFKDFRVAFVIDRARRRQRTLGLKNLIQYAAFLQQRLSENDREEMEGLISELTVKETSFFRDAEQFEYFRARILPSLSGRPSLRIMSAGCATGEEPFTIGIIVQYFFAGNTTSKSVDIFACDIDRRAIDACRKAEFPEGSRRLDGIPPPLMAKYLAKRNGIYVVSDEVRKIINFSYLNLISDEIPGMYDVIFCKNVLIYLSDEDKKIVIGKLTRALHPGGYLIFGTTEIMTPEHRDAFPELVPVDQIVFRKCEPNPRRVTATPAPIADPPQPDSSTGRATPRGGATGHAPNGIFTARLVGVIDEAREADHHSRFTKLMNEACHSGKMRIILDISDLKHISRAAVQQLIRVVRLLNRRGTHVMLTPAGDMRNYILRTPEAAGLTISSVTGLGYDLPQEKCECAAPEAAHG